MRYRLLATLVFCDMKTVILECNAKDVLNYDVTNDNATVIRDLLPTTGGFNGRPLVQWPTGPQASDVMGAPGIG